MFIIRTPFQTVYHRKGESILEALERTGHSVEYQCRQGYCGHCRLKLEQGKITYLESPLAYIPEGEFLSCCSVPAEDIEINSNLSFKK